METSKLPILAVVAGLAGTASVLLSIVYDVGYFQEFPFDLTSLPTSISDHLRAGINWIPVSLFFAFIGTLSNVVAPRLDKGKSEGQVVKSSRVPRLAQFGYSSPFIIAGVSMIAGPVGYLCFGVRFLELLAVGVPLLWILTASWFLKERPMSRMSRGAAAAFIGIPALIFMVFFWGRLQGHKDRNAPGNAMVNLVGRPAPVKVKILRAMERGVLVLTDDKKQVQFFTWQTIANFQTPIQPEFSGWLEF